MCVGFQNIVEVCLFFSVHFNVVAYMLFDITKILQNYFCPC